MNPPKLGTIPRVIDAAALIAAAAPGSELPAGILSASDADAAAQRMSVASDSDRNRPNSVAMSTAAKTPVSSEGASSVVAAALTLPSEIQNDETEVRVMHNFTALEATDLTITAGEVLWVVRTAGDWWKARDHTGRSGYIPANFVKLPGIEGEPWFHGLLGRHAASTLLRANPNEGVFLVRESENRPGQYALSVCHQGGELRHYPITLADGQYYISDRHKFCSVKELVEYHRFPSPLLLLPPAFSR